MEFVDSFLNQDAAAAASLEGPDGLPPSSYFEETGENVWICGRVFSAVKEEERSKVREVLQSFIWLTYRRGFPRIGEELGPTSDRGWGCMLRCGQMVLAEALTRFQLGIDWTWNPFTTNETYLKILSYFKDDPEAPFSIHQFAVIGAEDGGKAVGQWYGPNTVAHVVRKLVDKVKDIGLRVHVVMDNLLVKEEALSGDPWQPLVIFVPLRLGLSEVNPIYLPGLKACFKSESTSSSLLSRISLGVIGGTPNHALYFVGCVGDDLIYLDPHTTQNSVNLDRKTTDEEIEADTSYHCQLPRRMAVAQIDPSIAACFFCQTRQDFDDLCSWVKTRFVDVENQPIFEVVDTRPCYAHAAAGLDSHDFDYDEIKKSGLGGSDSSDEFEMIG